MASEAGVYGFAFEGEDPEDAFVDSVERFAGDEAFECFDAEGVFAECEGSFVAEPAFTSWREPPAHRNPHRRDACGRSHDRCRLRLRRHE